MSGDRAHRDDVFKMAKFMEDHLKGLGVQTRLEDLGTETIDGHEIELPPAVLGKIGEDPKKKTILIYGHFDVQPVSFLIANIITDQQNRNCEYRLSRAMDGTLTPSP